MGDKAHKQIVKFLEANGFSYDRTNSKRFDFYTHETHAEVCISPAIEDHVVKRLESSIQKALGIQTNKEKSKRSPELVKARHAAERERLAQSIDRHETEIADLIRQRNRRMDGLGKVLSSSEMFAIERLIEQKEHEIRGWQRLMQELPSNNSHSGRPKAEHRA